MTTVIQNGTIPQNGTAPQPGELVREMYGGEIYEYYPLGQYIVRAPGVCGGRPTFKYTRLEPSIILALLAQGDTVEDVLENYHRSKIPAEAIYLASQAFMTLHHTPLPHAAEMEVA